MVQIVWEFDVADAAGPPFEAAYGTHGPWVALFRDDPAYLGTTLLRDVAHGGRYVTIDAWRDAAAYAAFRARAGTAYAALDARCEALTRAERHIGTYEVIA
jgi:quinol monooxygenase YgiN